MFRYQVLIKIESYLYLFVIDYCLINELCFRNGQFNESNRCQLCNASQSKDFWTENPGMFTILTICRRVDCRISYFKMSVGKGIRFDKILCNFYPITHAHVNLNFIIFFSSLNTFSL